MVENRRPEAAELHRRQRVKNLVVAGFLLAIVVVFFVLTIVRIGDKA